MRFNLVNKINYPVAELRGIESVIPAHPESFCIKEGFPTSGNDKRDKNYRTLKQSLINSLD